MKLSRPSFGLLKHHKRLVVVTICAFVIATMLGYAAWSKQQWSEYHPSYVAHQTAIRASLDSLKSRSVTAVVDKTKVRTDLVEVSRQIETRGKGSCQVNSLVAWQAALMKSLQQEQEQCQAQMVKLAALNEPLKRLIAFLNNDEAVAKELGRVSSTDEVADTAWQAQLDVWQSVNQAIKKQSVAGDYKSVQTLAVEKTNTVVTAWQAIIAAHSAKDKQAFMSAQSGLGQAYDELDMVSIETAKVAASLAKAVEEKYQDAF
jgi:hypothetical protein